MPKVCKKSNKTPRETCLHKQMKQCTIKSDNPLIDLLDFSLFDLAKQLINSQPDLLNKTDGIFYPLESVVDNAEMFEYLHKHGANINQMLASNKNLLIKAIDAQSLSVVSYILLHCDPNIVTNACLDNAKQLQQNLTSHQIINMIKRYQEYETYDEIDEDLLLINKDSEYECRKVLKLFLTNDKKVNCYLKRNLSAMSPIQQKKCFSILKDQLNFWAF